MIVKLKAAAALGAVAAILSSGPVAGADAEECQAAINSYNSAIDEISTRLRRYSSCVSGSKGQDDCSSEFRRLRSAQSDFESAVSEYQSDCD